MKHVAPAHREMLRNNNTPTPRRTREPENHRPPALFLREARSAAPQLDWHGVCISSGSRVHTTKDEVSMKLLLAVNAVSENHRRIALLALLSFAALC
jgi:hypothetical protein